MADYSYDRTAAADKTAKLGAGAAKILKEIKDLMQEADELGGTDSTEEYADLCKPSRTRR